jgi:hypothetical protein
MAPITINSNHLVVDFNDETSAIAAVTPQPLNSGFSARGNGYHKINPAVSGIRGRLEAFVIPGTQTADNVIACLKIGEVSSAVQYLLLGSNNANKVKVIITDNFSNIVAETDATAPDMLPGQFISLTVTWDSTLGTVGLTVGPQAQPASIFSTYPAGVPWTHFVPTFLAVGAPVLTRIPFVGSIARVNVSSV